jgi:hypothetical protein
MSDGKFMVRQGDVLIMEESKKATTKDHREVKHDPDGSLVLAHGEVTGHHHRIRGVSSTLLRAEGISDAVLTMGSSGILVHEEHAPIEIPAGTYVVRRQMEYSEQDVRLVAD